MDDGSRDGTFEFVQREFPEVIITRNETALGSVPSRNQILHRVRGDILIGFDDDSRFVCRDSTKRIVERFENEPDLGLMGFQTIGPQHPDTIAAEPVRRAGTRHIASFASCAFGSAARCLKKWGFIPSSSSMLREADLAIRNESPSRVLRRHGRRTRIKPRLFKHRAADRNAPDPKLAICRVPARRTGSAAMVSGCCGPIVWKPISPRSGSFSNRSTIRFVLSRQTNRLSSSKPIKISPRTLCRIWFRLGTDPARFHCE